MRREEGQVCSCLGLVPVLPCYRICLFANVKCPPLSSVRRDLFPLPDDVALHRDSLLAQGEEEQGEEVDVEEEEAKGS
jgi:hypothetical protein